MIQSYEVGSIFKIVDQASPTLVKLYEGFEKLHGKITEVQRQVAEFGKGAGAGLTNSFGKLETKLAGIADKAGAANKAMVESFGKMDVAVDASVRGVDRLKVSLAEAADASKAFGRLRLPGGGGSGGGGGPGPGPDDSPRPHRRPSRGRGHHGPAREIGMDLGFGSLMSAGALVEVEKSAYEKAAEFAHVQMQMKFAGFTPDEVMRSSKSSWDVANKLGLNATDVMKDIKEIRQPFGSVDEVLHFLEPLEKMRVVLNAVSEGKGNSSKEAVYEMVRSGELKGLNTADDYMKYFDDMTKVISATGGKVGPKEFMQATKYSRLAALGMNEEFYTKYLPTLIQGLGASGAGTASASLFGTLIQGKATGRATQALDDLGLIGDRSKLRFKKGTKDADGFSAGALVDTDLAIANPFEWVKKDLLPRLEKKYGSLDNEKSRMDAVKALGDFFGNRMSAQDAGEFLLRMKSFDRDAKFNQNGLGIKEVDQLLKNDPTTVMNKFTNSWTNFLNAFAASMVDPVIKTIDAFSDVFVMMNKWATANPTATKLIGEALIGLAGGLALIGGAAVVAGAILLAPEAAIAVAIGGIVGAITALAACNWDSVCAGLKSFWDTIKGFFSDTSSNPNWDGSGKTLPISPLEKHNFLPVPKKLSYGGGDDDGSMGAKLIQASFGGGADGKATAVIAGGVAGGITNSAGGVINILGGDGAGSGGYAGGGYGGGGGGGGGGGRGRRGYGGGGGGGGDNTPVGTMPDAPATNARLAADRKPFFDELARNPTLMRQVIKVASMENNGSSARMQTVIESMVNRAKMLGYHSLHEAIFSGFYGPVNRGEDGGVNGPLTAKEKADGLRALGAVAAGGNSIGYRTDQGMLSDSGARKYMRQADKSGWAVVNGENFFFMGPQGKAWARQQMEADRKKPPPPPPAPKQDTTHIHNIHMDGKVMARIVTKHQTAMARMPHAVGGQDDYGSWSSPGTTMMPA